MTTALGLLGGWVVIAAEPSDSPLAVRADVVRGCRIEVLPGVPLRDPSSGVIVTCTTGATPARPLITYSPPPSLSAGADVIETRSESTVTINF